MISDPDRRGNERFYFRRRPEPKIRIRAKLGTAAFRKIYDDCLSGRVPTAAPRVRAADPGTFAALCAAYFGSDQFKDLDVSTRQWRRRALEGICVAHGTKRVALMQPRHVRSLRDAKRSTPAAANTLLKALRALFSWAMENDLASVDPTHGVKFVAYRPKGHHTWTPAEIAAFERKHPLGSQARLALALLRFTACRREDVVRFGPHNFMNGRFRFRQAKNEHRDPVEIDIPVHPELAAALAAMPELRTATFIATVHGRPFTPNGFGNKFKDWCMQAGIPHCTSHGCRKATAAQLAQSGATPFQIMAVTGHRTLAEVERYTREVQRAYLADEALGLMSDASRRGRAPATAAGHPGDAWPGSPEDGPER